MGIKILVFQIQINLGYWFKVIILVKSKVFVDMCKKNALLLNLSKILRKWSTYEKEL